jgi:hypothetical protein
MRVAGIPLGVGNSVLPPVSPTGIYLFNGANGATTDTNSAIVPIGSIQFFNGAAISTAKAYEGSGSVRLTGGGAFVGYTPTLTDSNNSVTARDFYFSIAFNVDGNDSSERGLMFAENSGGQLLFRAYLQNGQVKCFIRQIDGTTYTVTVPTLNCAADTWYKLEISRKFATSEFKVKVGSDEVTQILTADFANLIGRLDIGVYYSGAEFIGYVDRLVYQMDSIVPY